MTLIRWVKGEEGQRGERKETNLLGLPLHQVSDDVECKCITKNKKMKYKAIFKYVLILFVVLVFSGCTTRGKSDGGTFKSFDGGVTFEHKVKVGEEGSLANANILDLQIDPNDSSVLYVGTSGMGILRSVDGGNGWVQDVNGYQSVESIVINPNNSSELYIAARVGGHGKILKTSSGGENWQEVFIERTGDARVLSLAMDKNNTNVLYAGDTLGGIYKTEDAGETWKTLLWAQSAVRKITIDSVNTNRIYIVTTNSGVLRSDDGGTNYAEVKTSGTVFNLVVHPTRDNVVFISDGEGLHRSTDGGATLEQINTLVKPEELGSRGLAINPQNDNEIYFASGRAFYKTNNGGQTWKPIQFNSSRTVRIIEVDPDNPSTIYIGTGQQSQSSGFSLFPSL